MAAATIVLKRTAWKEDFDSSLPLETQLPYPHMRVWQAAFVVGVSDSTAYDSCKRYHAATMAGDEGAASREIPCVLLGSSHRIPTAAFVEWWMKAGRGMTHQHHEVGP